mgnify:CR=1 FL=1
MRLCEHPAQHRLPYYCIDPLARLNPCPRGILLFTQFETDIIEPTRQAIAGNWFGLDHVYPGSQAARLGGVEAGFEVTAVTLYATNRGPRPQSS